MASEVILPKLGMNTETVTIVQWFKGEGDRVGVGDVLAEVETEKANVELEAEVAGVLRRRFAIDGEQVTVNQTIAVIGTADEDISDLEQRIAASSDSKSSFVAEVYETWHGPTLTTASNGAQQSVVTNDTSPRLNTSIRQRQPSRVDPDLIRARLTKRGILTSNGSASTPKTTRLVIYGAGLGAKQLLEITRLVDDVEVIGVIDDDPELSGSSVGDVRILGGFATLANLTEQLQIDGVALSFHSHIRKQIHERIKSRLPTRIIPLVDPRAIVGMNVTIEDGALIEAGSVIGPGTIVGEGTIVDVGAVVAHDCYLGPFSHLSPGCALSGVVCLKENVLVGVGASLNSTITVGTNVIITPGAAVMNDVPDDVVVSGVPAKSIGASRRGIVQMG